jgi:hypothetical protein
MESGIERDCWAHMSEAQTKHSSFSRERESLWDMDRGRRSVDVIPVFQYFWGVSEVGLEGKPAAVLLLKNPMHERTLHPPAGQFL